MLPPPRVVVDGAASGGNTPDFSASGAGKLEGDIDHDMEKLTRAVEVRGARMNRVFFIFI